MATFFEDIGDSAEAQAPRDPIWAINLDDPSNEKEILRWLNSEIQFLINASHDRVKRQQRNLALYKGIQYESQDTRQEKRDIGESRSNVMKKIVSNQLHDLADNRASRLIKYKPAVAILPTNDELEDKISAKMTKALLDHIWYENKFEGELSLKAATWAMVLGEFYQFPKWNPQKGDLAKSYKEAKKNAEKKGGKIPLLGEDGKQKTDPAGNPIWIEKPVKTGDVDYWMPLPMDVFPERTTAWDLANYIFVREVLSVDIARAKYPEAASKIKAQDQGNIYDYETMSTRPARNEVVLYHFMHRRSDFLDGGRHIIFSADAIIKNIPSEYSHRDLPCVRFTDVDFPGEVQGYSFFELVKGLTGTYNNLINLVLRNQVMVSHPKWMMPVGAAKLDQLGNDITVVQYKGPQPPVLVQANPTPKEIFDFITMLKEEFQQISGVFGVSRGEPPPGIKAGVALQFLSEQESERFNRLILKWNEFVRQLAIQTIAVAGDYYDADDERMIRVVGKDNAWMTQFFDVAHLSKDYDIRIQNSSALPQSKAARMQTLLDLSERYPNEMPGAQVLDMLDLGQSDKFIDIATISIRTAEAENEKIMDIASPNQKFEPAEYEDHVQHWKVHMRDIQGFGFKYMTPDAKQENLKEHVMVHEMMLWEKMQANPMLAQAIQADPAMKLFPVFFVPAPPPEALPPTEVPPPSGPGAPGEPFGPEPGLPVNPELGGEPQLPAAPPMPGLEQQMQSDPGAEPLQPTGAI